MVSMENVFETLVSLGIEYDKYTHQPVFTVEEARECEIPEEFGETKNLFLRNRKGDKHYLVTVEASKQVDLKKLTSELGEDRLMFASPERLKKYLGLTPGSVSSFGLINDKHSDVIFILDKGLLEHEKVGLHPNINTQTLLIKSDDFMKYLDSLNNTVIQLEL